MIRNVVDIEKIKCKKDFFVWFIMNCFPKGIDEENDMSMYEVIENYSFDTNWVNKLTNYYDGVFEENDGYVDNPNSLIAHLNNQCDWDGSDIFSFSNWIGVMICSEKLKEACEKEKIKGISFHPIEKLHL